MNQLAQYLDLDRYVSSLKDIPGGTYLFGASNDCEEPGTPITMSAFRLGATPVTWGMWKEYCEAKSVRRPDDPGWGYPNDHPVVNVSWEDIMDTGGFCEWASGVAGFKLTLPTDAQYEYAARGGKNGLEYPWGNDFDKSKLWCSNSFGDASKTAAVDRTDRIYRNGYGLTDMAGNVWQWCADYYNEDYRPTGNDPVDTKKSNTRCLRGGSWFYYNPVFCQCASRSGDNRDFGNDEDGFRLSAGLV